MKLALTVAGTVAALLFMATAPQAAPAVTPAAAPAAAGTCPAFLNHDFRKLRSSGSVNICKDFAGKPLLIVNTASHCGYTPQFKGLQALHEKYKDKGLVVVGFPSDVVAHGGDRPQRQPGVRRTGTSAASARLELQ